MRKTLEVKLPSALNQRPWRKAQKAQVKRSLRSRFPSDSYAPGQLAGKAQKITIKLPWEITNVFSDVLPNDEEEDEDDVEAHEASLQRLKVSPKLLAYMCIRADCFVRKPMRRRRRCPERSMNSILTAVKRPSPTGKVRICCVAWSSGSPILPAKRFREFLNLPPAIDLKPNDDTVDIVGFLAYEMVRSLTLAGLQVKRSLEDAAFLDGGSPGAAGRKRRLVADDLIASKRRRASDDEEPLVAATCSLFAPPLEARTAIQPEHIQDALARIQNDRHHQRSAGMRNWRGGLIRTKVALI
jgi:transcription initiation protein SPT3